jgi:hypothetical protein
MADLLTFDLPTTLRDSAKMIACAKVLLAHLDKNTSLPHQKPLRHITDYMIGELEKAASAASQSQTLKLAAATRNLFELSFAVEYVCASDQNMDRFVVDAAIDELEIMQKLLAIDKRAASHQPDAKSQQREQKLKAQIAKANLTGSGPLQVIDIAKAVNREAEYRALYKVYSKMTHATAWAIVGTCSWENIALLVLLKANGYAAGCVKHIAQKTSLPVNTACA